MTLVAGADKKSIPVAVERCPSYDRQRLDQVVDKVIAALAFTPARGSRVLLKPNLVVAGHHADLACTHPEFVAAVARWFVEQGVKVAVGDSPATGSGQRAMRISGLFAALGNLPVAIAPFQEVVKVATPGGLTIGVARDVLECDYFVNLPKLKSHSQTRLTLAVKNHYGIIKGWRKAWGHQQHGKGDARPFFELLADLPALVPPGLSLCDAVTAMHVTGPSGGMSYEMGLVAGSTSPWALDRALMEIVGVAPQQVPLWQVGSDRSQPGTNLDELYFPLLHPQEVSVQDFIVPDDLHLVRFSLRHVMTSLLGRFRVWLARRRDRSRGHT